MPRATQTQHRRSRILLLGGMIVAGLILAAVAYDMGRLSLVRSQLQTAADNTALAAATRLDRPREELTGHARRFAGHFLSASDAIRQADVHVELGHWDAESRRFTPDDSQGAVRVSCRLGGPHGRGEVQLFFGRLFGLNSVPVAASAVATTDDARASRGTRTVAAHDADQAAPAAQVRLVQ